MCYCLSVALIRPELWGCRAPTSSAPYLRLRLLSAQPLFGARSALAAADWCKAKGSSSKSVQLRSQPGAERDEEGAATSSAAGASSTSGKAPVTDEKIHLPIDETVAPAAPRTKVRAPVLR